MNNLTEKSDATLRELLQASRQTLAALVEILASRPHMQIAIRRLLRPDDMLETFRELAVKEPDLMRLVLQASLGAVASRQGRRIEFFLWKVGCQIYRCENPAAGNVLNSCSSNPNTRLSATELDARIWDFMRSQSAK